MGKLTGQTYPAYWRDRMAKGPDQASFNGIDADGQGEQIWHFIEPHIKALQPDSIMDFGCGYGRMMRRLRALWPEAHFYGVDLSEEALSSIRSNWRDGEPPRLFTSIPEQLRVDLIFDCMALQHITDDHVLRETVATFAWALNPGGAFVLFENTSRPGADHVRDMHTTDYMDLWPDIGWGRAWRLDLNGQFHSLLIGVKQ